GRAEGGDHGGVAEVQADEVLADLEERRGDERAEDDVAPAQVHRRQELEDRGEEPRDHDEGDERGKRGGGGRASRAQAEARADERKRRVDRERDQQEESE